MSNASPKPEQQPLLLLDGGLGTTLQDNFGVKFSADTPLWSGQLLISDPATLLRAQTAFAQAGADVILTATYQASFTGFAKSPRHSDDKNKASGGNNDDGIGYDKEQAAAYMRSAIGIAKTAFRQAGKPDGLVALSLGAYGATMTPSTEYSGEYDAIMADWKGLYNFHWERLQAFVHEDVDWHRIAFVAFETLPVVREVRAVRETMKTLADTHGIRARFWITCVFPNQDLRLPDGTTVEELVEELLSPNLPLPYAIGINCTKISLLRPLLAQFEAAVQNTRATFSLGEYTPRLAIYPDGANNLVYDTTLQEWLPKDSAASSPAKAWGQEMNELVKEVQGRQAWPGILVGGCCKAGPEDIRLLRQKLDE